MSADKLVGGNAPGVSGFMIGPHLRGTLKEMVDVHKSVKQRDPSLKRSALAEPSYAKTIRICTATGTWAKSTDKTVTYTQDTSYTFVVTNVFAPLTNTGTYNIAAVKDGTSWYLIAAECS